MVNGKSIMYIYLDLPVRMPNGSVTGFESTVP